MKKYLLLTFTILPFFLTSAQNMRGLYAGAGIGTEILLDNNPGYSSYQIMPPPQLYIHLGYGFSNYLCTEISGGYIFTADNWDGFDFGASVKTHLAGRFSVSAGLNYESVGGGGGEHGPLYYKKNFYFGGAGLQYYVDKSARITLDYFLPLNSDKSYSSNLDLYGKFKLGFGWDFKI